MTRTIGPEHTGSKGSRPSTGAMLRILPLGALAALGGCISVKAPEKPIVIELNINIKQEVVYRLARDANATIESNPEIF